MIIRNCHYGAFILAAVALAGITLATTRASAGVVFSESFESPVVTGFDDNTVPSGGNWIGATAGFGATTRGLYNETFAWPATSAFSTPYGYQAYIIAYSNSGLTTAVGATGQTLTADITYKLTFNTALTTGTASGSYLVELVAFAPADDNAARAECRGNRPGTVLATATATVTTNDMSAAGSLTFTPNGANAHLGKDLGIRLIKASNNVLYDNIRLVTGHDMLPSPASGVHLPAGNTILSWSNMPPNTPGGDVPVDVWFGTNPAALTQIVDGVLTSTTNVNAPSAGTYYWRVDSYPDGNPNGIPVTGDQFFFVVTDSDGDGLPDAYEQANTTPSSATSLVPASDLDTDGLTAAQEYYYGTNPNDNDTDNDTLLDGPELTGVGLRPATSPVDADSDDDGLSDGVETNTGTWVGITNTGTNPKDNDKDKDGLMDGAETNTGTVVDKNNTGTDPFDTDTDNDGVGDYYEVVACFTSPFNPIDKPRVPYPLPDPDASAGVTNKPVKVYIMSGQSNMVGLGRVYGTDDKSLEHMTLRQNRFPNLVNAAGGWTQRQDVRYRGVISAIHNKGLTPGCGADSNNMGPELGFGHIMGWYHDEPVLLIKSSIGNRSLGWDILPKGSPSWVYNSTTYPGYGFPTPAAVGDWYAGYEWDRFFMADSEAAHPHGTAEFNVVDVLDNFAAQYPNWAAQGFEIAGFVWWQGEKDLGDAGHANSYEPNLVRLINSLRSYYSTRYPGKVVPNAPFVLGTLGEATLSMTAPANDVAVRDAHLAVDGTTGSNPQINVKTVYTNPLSEGGFGNGHYGNRAGTYMLVGDAMGRAMLEMQDDTSPPSPDPMTFAIAPTAVNTSTVGMVATTAVDPSGPVQYWFENTSNSTNSGWITSTRWDSTGLTNGVSQDFRVKAKDSEGNETAFSAVASAAPGNDVTKPAPDPMTFAGPLQVLGENSISMAATTATDINGVEYFFDCTVGGGTDSGWQSGTQFIATGLTPATAYTYVVRARDSVGNITADSASASATTLAPDTSPPSPATMSFSSPPAALGTSSITMTAAAALDPSGVEYFFDETSGNSGGSDSGWQDSPTYIDSDLQPGTQYTYQVRARDKSPAQTANSFSPQTSATTELPDTTPPTVINFNPASGAVDIAPSANLILTFDEEIVPGTGLITIKNLTDATESTIDVTNSSQVTAAGAVLTINPPTNLANAKNYAIQIAATAVKDLENNYFTGIANDTTWTFTSAVVPYVWTKTLGGAQAWTTDANWQGGLAPSPITGDTIDFSTVNIALDTSLTLGADRTARLWKFGDTSGAQNWIVSAGNQIILAGTTPTIEVKQNTTTLNNVVTGISGLKKTGAGTVSLSGNNTYSGGTDVTAGAIIVGHANAFGSGLVTVSENSTIDVAYGLFPVIPNALHVGSAKTLTTTGSTQYFGMTFSGQVTGSGTIKTGGNGNNSNTANKLGLTNSTNSFTGTLRNEGGSAIIAVNSLGDGGKIQLTANNADAGGFALNTGTATPLLFTTRQVELLGSSAIYNNNATASNTITINTNLAIGSTGDKTLSLRGGNTGNNTYGGIIANGNFSAATQVISLKKYDTGNWILTGVNTYTGKTTISAGTLSINSIGDVSGGSSALGNPSSAANGSILMGSGNSTATLLYTGAGHSSGRTIQINSSDNTNTGGATLTNNGSGALTFTAPTFNNTYTLASVITRTLTLGGSYSGSPNQIQGIIQDNSANGKVAVTKANDASTWILSGVNTYAGSTTVNGGTLLVNSPGSLASGSAVAVNGSSTLGGNGTIGGTVTVAAAASLAPGASAGTLAIGGGLNISALANNGAGKLRFELGPIAASDKITVGGMLTIGTAYLGFNDFVFSPLAGLQNGTYTLITYNTLSGTLAASGLSGAIGTGTATLQLNTVSNSLELVVSGQVSTSPYETWAVGGVAFDADSNSDGVDNGMAWLLGAANPSENALGKLPVASRNGTSLRLTFRCLKSDKRGGAQLKVQSSNDCGASDPWTNHEAAVPDADSTVNGVIFDTTADGDFINVIADIPAGGTKLFGRLKATP